MLSRFSLAPTFALLCSFVSAVQAAVPVTTLCVHQAEVTSVVWSNDGKTIASGDKKNVIVLTDAITGKTWLRLSYKGAATPLSFSPDGKLLVVGRDTEIRLLNSRTGALIKIMEDSCDTARFSLDGKMLTTTVLVEESKKSFFEASLWNVASGKKVSSRRWPQEQDGFGDFASGISSRDNRVATSTNSKLHIYDVRHSRPLTVVLPDLKAEESPIVLALSWSGDGRWIGTTGGYYEGPGHFDVWDAQNHRRAWGNTFHDWSPCLAFSPHNRLLAVGTTYETTYDETRRPGNVVLLYNLQTHKLSSTLSGHKGDVNALAWSPDGKRIASGSDDKTVNIWTLAR